MIKYNEIEIIKGFQQNDRVIINDVYLKNYPTIRNYVLKNSGDEVEAKDIFQEALVVIFKKVEQESFRLTSSFNTYLFSICRNIWLKCLRERKYSREDNFDFNESNDYKLYNDEETIEVDIDNEYDENLEEKIYHENFNKLSDECKQVIKLFLEDLSFKEIAKIMNYNDHFHARKRKYQCKLSLLSKIKKDPKYIQIKKSL